MAWQAYLVHDNRRSGEARFELLFSCRTLLFALVMVAPPAAGFGLRLEQWIAWLGLAAVGCTWFDKQRVSLLPARTCSCFQT